MSTVWTIGYEHLLPPALATELAHAGIERVLDVRYRPQSRRPGMSKTRLGEMLADHRIAYEHHKALGTPPDIRWLFKNRRVPEGREAYRAWVESTVSHELDELLSELRDGPRTALLCLEEDPAVCHRRVLCEALAARDPSLVVVDL